MNKKDQPSNTLLGNTGPRVFPIGLGCMALSGSYGAATDEEGIKTIHRALDKGVTLLDTGDFYGMGHNEMLIGRALKGRRDDVQISVKFGALRSPAGDWGGIDCRPAAVKNFAAYSLKRLGVEVIDIYRPARLDPAVPIEDTVGAIVELIDKGYVRHIGLSEVGAETIRKAHAVHPIVDLQIEYSVASRGPEDNLFTVLEELGISATLYGILSRGLLSGRKPVGQGDFRTFLPRFAGDNLQANQKRIDKLDAIAKAGERSTAQLCLAWVLAKQPRLVPLAGSRTAAQLDDLLGVLDAPLTSEEVAQVDDVCPPGAFEGSRYPAPMMEHLDSEKQAQRAAAPTPVPNASVVKPPPDASFTR